MSCPANVTLSDVTKYQATKALVSYEKRILYPPESVARSPVGELPEKADIGCRIFFRRIDPFSARIRSSG
jgi:hypothetical protein